MSAFLKQNWTSNESASQIPQINTAISIKSAADVPKFGMERVATRFPNFSGGRSRFRGFFSKIEDLDLVLVVQKGRLKIVHPRSV